MVNNLRSALHLLLMKIVLIEEYLQTDKFFQFRKLTIIPGTIPAPAYPRFLETRLA